MQYVLIIEWNEAIDHFVLVLFAFKFSKQCRELISKRDTGAPPHSAPHARFLR